MRSEEKRGNEYLEEIRFLCKYKIETMSDVDNIKEQKKEDIRYNVGAEMCLKFFEKIL